MNISTYKTYSYIMCTSDRKKEFYFIYNGDTVLFNMKKVNNRNMFLDAFIKPNDKKYIV